MTSTSVLALAGCAGDSVREEPLSASVGVGSDGDTAAVGESSEGPVSTSGAGGSSDESTGSGEFRFDVADSNESAGDSADGTSGCEKVDLLFVIDDSISMAGEQQNLIASFPAFIEGIQTGLEGVSSYHVGVVTTNVYGYNAPDCRQIGTLVTSTGGANSSGAACGPFSEGRYLGSGDNLEQQFACAAQVGTDGPVDERPMQAMQTAVGPVHAVPGGCNEGFVRSDALLVVVIVTDEEDDIVEFYDTVEGSPGDPQTWFDDLVATKTYEENIAVLSIIGGQPGNVCPEPYGVDGAEDAPRIRAFTEMFTNGFLGDVCAPTYGPFFDQAIGVVESACGGFIPPEG